MNNDNQKIDRDDNIWDQVTIIRGKVAAAEKKEMAEWFLLKKNTPL